MKSAFSTLSKILLVSLLLFVSCKSDPKDTTSNNNTTSQPVGANTPAEPTASTHISASSTAPLIGLWHYHNIGGNKEKTVAYKGRWVDLKADMTYTSGIYLEENNSGTWTYSDKTKLIKLMPKETEEIETEWVVSGNGEFILWLGNTSNNKSGIQIRMKKIMDGAKPAK